MDREISFRGKVTGLPLYLQDKKKVGTWVYGSYLSYPTAQIVDLEDEYVVDPATVGQYTFLNDIDDKKIFTADILQDKITGDRYVVDFIGGGFGLFSMKEYLDLKHRHQVILWDGLSELQTACFVAQNLEIIGNIHDNPELLKEAPECH